MFESYTILALIPARGGSKGIKDKNIINLRGKPLISYSIEAARNSKYIDSVVVTTDSERIELIAKERGAEVPFLRPKELASDTSKTIDAVIHSIKELNKMERFYDILVLLQPTQPLRTSEDIDKSIELFFLNKQKSLVSVSPVENHPLLIRMISEKGELVNLLENHSTCRRQDMKQYYCVNGCIYINRVDEVNDDLSFNDNEIPYIMPKERAVDIDEVEDLFLAEYYLRYYGEKNIE